MISRFQPAATSDLCNVGVNSQSFDTTNANLCIADEISLVNCPLPNDTELGATLTFDSTSTGLARTFRIQAIEEQFWFNSPGFDDPRDKLVVGRGQNNFDNDDWTMDLLDGPDLYAFSFHLLDNDAGPDVFSVYDPQGLIGTCPISVNHETQFVGVVSDTRITRTELDEDPGIDNIAIADFRFAEKAAVPTVSEYGFMTMIVLLVGAGILVLNRTRQRT